MPELRTPTDCDRLLTALRTGPKTAAELYRLGMVVHSRAASLREKGYDVRCERVPGGGAKSYVYRLAGEPMVESEPPVFEDSSRTAGRPAGSGAIRKDALSGGSLSPVDTPEQLTLVAV